MANWAWSCETTISGLDPNGASASMNGQPAFSRDSGRNVFATLKFTSDDPNDAPIFETTFGVDITGQFIADKGYGRCNALNLSDAAQAALAANPPTPDIFTWSFDPTVIAKRNAELAETQAISKLSELKALSDAGGAVDPARLQAALKAANDATGAVAVAEAQQVKAG